jgi:hypothetical protein
MRDTIGRLATSEATESGFRVRAGTLTLLEATGAFDHEGVRELERKGIPDAPPPPPGALHERLFG